MTLPPTLPPGPAAPLLLSPPKLPLILVPSLWSQLDPIRQRQLAQHWVELVRRLQLQLDPKEVNTHD